MGAILKQMTHRSGRLGLGVRDPEHSLQAVAEQVVGPVLYLPGDVGARRAAVRRVVLEAAAVGRIVRGRDDDAGRGLRCGLDCR